MRSFAYVQTSTCSRVLITSDSSRTYIEDSIPERGFAAGLEGSLCSMEPDRDGTARCGGDGRAGICDQCAHGCDAVGVAAGAVEEAMRRGKAFLEAGATTMFVWGEGQDTSRAEMEKFLRGWGDGRGAGGYRAPETQGTARKQAGVFVRSKQGKKAEKRSEHLSLVIVMIRISGRRGSGKDANGDAWPRIDKHRFPGRHQTPATNRCGTAS
ncbi:hypothetical protein C8R44DRAFT_754111 [Mycena epipterygia]|nr:hypothetical protein C8R44DRAFT_754111 [Mycena epipterygia]